MNGRVVAVRTIIAMTVLGSAFSVSCAPQESSSAGAQSSVERGQYLVTVAGCNDCHSPKVFVGGVPMPDTTRLLSGHPADETVAPTPAGMLSPQGWGALASPDFTAWSGPWGVSFTANLTPDTTGLLLWTKEQFIQTMRTGKHMGLARPLLPPMPWQNFGQMTDADLGSVFDYLRTLKPIKNSVPGPIPPAQVTH